MYEDLDKPFNKTLPVQSSPLSQLLDNQDETKALLVTLAEKLLPVSNPHPTDKGDRSDRGYHIETALYKQLEINDDIRYLIDTLAL